MIKFKAKYNVNIRSAPFAGSSFGLVYAGGFFDAEKVDDKAEHPVTHKMTTWAYSADGHCVCVHDGERLFMERVSESAPSMPVPPPTFPTIPPQNVIAALKDFRDAQALIEHGIKALEGLKE